MNSAALSSVGFDKRLFSSNPQRFYTAEIASVRPSLLAPRIGPCKGPKLTKCFGFWLVAFRGDLSKAPILGG